MEFIFAKPTECNLHLVREFYANCELEARSHIVKVWDTNVTLAPLLLNELLRTTLLC
uniref:Uncharacterized protein n=1 Tax=Solanum tuberosum TaxID=4113 RepID=M1CNG2_SOLTU